jgi:hypothetical protein
VPFQFEDREKGEKYRRLTHDAVARVVEDAS